MMVDAPGAELGSKWPAIQQIGDEHSEDFAHCGVEGQYKKLN